jgi:phosphoglycerate kinase
MKFIDELNLRGKRVFMRVDFNVPLDAGLNITDDHRIRAALPSMRHVIEAGGRLVLASHLGRPGGKRVAEYSLAPVAARVGDILGRKVGFAPDCIGDVVERMAGELGDGDVMLLENLRFYPGETKNDPEFAAALARLADVYVNDAFAVSHRAHASVVGIPAMVSECGAGFLLKNEVEYFHRALEAPERPLVAILGGAKVSSKLGAVRNILPVVDVLVIVGAMANTFLKASGCDVAGSLVEDDLVPTALELMRKAEETGRKIVLPLDCVVADGLEEDAETGIVRVESVPEGKMILDIGPETVEIVSDVVSEAGTVVWNGPAGAFEIKPFRSGTMEIAHAVGASSALSIIGGGDTDAAVHMAGEAGNISYMSTGGGAFLTLLEGKKLPGFEALEG